MEEIKVDIDVICAECGGELIVEQRFSGEIKVSVCEVCLQREKEAVE